MNIQKLKIAPKSDSWDMIITPDRKWWDLKLYEVWRYRELIFMFVSRRFAASYKQTIIGPYWHLIRPLFSSGIYTIIFGKLAQLPTDDIPPFLFYMSGNIIWNYFSSCLSGTSNTFTANSAMFEKVYFPRLIMPLTTIVANLAQFGIRFLVFAGLLIYFLVADFPITPNWWMLLTPVLLLMMAGLGLGAGIITSSLTTKYRDLGILVNFGLNLLMYATPVIYPASMIPTQFQFFYFLNPVAPIVEAFRYGFLGAGTVDFLKIGYSFVFMVILLMIGLVMFNKIEATFLDTV
jgi:lipopolysaccharide transport system permease protein